MRVVRINQGKALSLPFRFVIALILMGAIFKALVLLSEPYSIFVAIILSFLVPAIWFATSLIIIDEERHILFKGNWAMGFKFGKKIVFSSIKEILVKKVKTKKKYHTLSNNQAFFSDQEYRAYVVIDSDEQYFLISHPNQERVKEKCNHLVKKLALNNTTLKW